MKELFIQLASIGPSKYIFSGNVIGPNLAVKM